jgi:hypothetical protein
MRTEIVSALKDLGSSTLGTFSVVDHLPWSQDNQPLYVMNPKRIYVDQSQLDFDPITDTLDGQGFAMELVTTRVYFAADAKQLPSNHNTLVQAIQDLRLDFADNGYRQRRVTTTSEFVSDLITLTFEFVFQRVVTN